MEDSQTAAMLAMTFDNIGYFKGKAISKMSRDELLDFAVWAGKEIYRLNKVERDTENYRIEKEIKLS